MGSKIIRVGAGVIAWAVLGLDAVSVARAQPYCAVYDVGNKSCGIPSLEACQQSVSGAGGICEPDESASLNPDLFQRPRLFRPEPAPPPNSDDPNNPDWMPPPPPDL
jgi:hypothetical protein